MHAHMGVHNRTTQNNDVIAFIPGFFFPGGVLISVKLRRRQAGGQKNQTAAELCWRTEATAVILILTETAECQIADI